MIVYFIAVKEILCWYSDVFSCISCALGADWKVKDNDGQSAIHLSTKHKSPKCLALLLRHLQPGEVDDQDENKACLSTSVIHDICYFVIVAVRPVTKTVEYN